MPTLHLTIDTAANAKLLAAVLSTMKSVKSVSIEPQLQEEFNWLNPSRPATDEEIEKMLDECERSPLLSARESKKRTAKELKEWRAKK